MARRRVRVAVIGVVAAVLAVGGWVATWSTSAGPAAGAALSGPATRPVGPTLRVATFNIDGGEGLDGRVDLGRTAKTLQRVDVASLQEVHGFGGDVPTNQAEALGGLLKLPFLFAPAERHWGHDSFGNGLLCDLPVTRWERVVLPSAAAHAKRCYLLATADWHGRPLSILATHVDFKAGGDEQLRIVIGRFLSLPTPAILMGDLNHPATAPQIVALLRTPGVAEAVSAELEPVPGRVDWIFLRGLRPLDAGPADIQASDHPAYWAEVALADRPLTTREARQRAEVEAVQEPR